MTKLSNIMLVYVSAAIVVFLILLRFYLRSCVKKCTCKSKLFGKTVIITGANSGIGYHTALRLAGRGARTILACRDEERALAAVEKIKNETGNMQVIYRHLDLTSLQSVRDFANDVLKTEDRLDVLVNNAGACALRNEYTKDGIVEGMQVNHFGPFLLTLLLIPLLKNSRPSRIVNVSTLMYVFGFVNLEKFNEKRLNRINLYADSKLYNLLIQQEFSERLKETDITINSLHPGVIVTGILGIPNPLFAAFFKFICWVSPRTAEEGAETAVHLAVSEECKNVTGKFYIDCKETFLLPKAKDAVMATKVWSLSEKMVKNYL
ncbi:retinol dehydrogenase 14-like [Bicyclus anynana]|uniref:Retinol dehydrogenase 14-like n=1 Tax=Bicyclus anynana TaxID=110368 RepID=A0ABM3LK66_BICAN|nr:retinol dehydrogenase 14-like [Bicyclus anynana]